MLKLLLSVFLSSTKTSLQLVVVVVVVAEESYMPPALLQLMLKDDNYARLSTLCFVDTFASSLPL